MKRSTMNIIIVLTLGACLTFVVLLLVSNDSTNLPTAHAAELRVCPSGCVYASVQAAMDAAGNGDVIKVAAGTYTGVSARAGVTQVVYISKSITLRGGYTITNWTAAYPITQPTTLDAQGHGRVLYILGSISPTIEGLRITNGDGFAASDDDFRGGGVYMMTATTAIGNSWVFSNTAIYCGGLLIENSSARLSGNTIISNTASYGGGLCLDAATAILSNNTVTSNTATSFGPVVSRGGGIYLSASTATLRANIVANNIAAGGLGGGLYLGGSNAALSDNIVTSNIARNGGGLYLSSGSDTLNSNTVASNFAYAGSGLYLFRSAAKLVSNLVVSNTGSMGGAGLYLESSPATLSNNVVASNTMLGNGDGGGLHLSSSAATLSGNRVVANTAPYGGGMTLLGSDATLMNNVVADNQASSWGSGLLVVNSLPRLLHTTIARNGGGDGSGVYITSYITRSVVGMTNTIFVSQTVGITVVAGNTGTLQGTLWGSGAWANGINWGGDGTIITGTVNIFGDPAFVNLDAGDYHIGASSAARDVGVSAGVLIDIDNEPRPATGVDIGADEYWAPGALKHIYLPLIFKNYL